MEANKKYLAHKAFETAYDLYEAGHVAKARRAYEHAARLGSPYAQITLANLYDDYAFGKRYRKRARMLYRRALAHGMPQAAYNMAQLYRKEGSRRWYKFWLRKAAESGDNDAKIELRDAR